MNFSKWSGSGASALSRITLTIIGSSALLLVAAIYAHIKIDGNPDFTGSLVILDRIFDLSLAGVLAALTFSIGAGLSRVLQLKFLSAAEELAFSIMLGTGVTGIVVLMLGLVGLLKPLPIGLFVLLSFAVLRSQATRFFKLIERILVVATRTRKNTALLCLYLLIVVVLIIRASSPPWAVDEVIYHLPATKSFVDQGQVYPLYHQPLGNMPFLIHMIYAVCLLAHSDIAARLFSLLLTIVTSIALYGFSVRFLTRKVGIVAMFGFLSACIVVEVGVSTRIDVSLAGMLFLATYAMILYLDNRNIKWLVASAILSGFSMGIKLNALLWLVCLGIMLLVELIVRLRVNPPQLAKAIGLYVFITLTVSSPWLIKNTIWFHNPVYPFITGELAEFNEGYPRYFNREDELRLDAHFDTARRTSPEEFQTVKTKFDEAVETAKHESQRYPMRFWEYYLHPHKYFMGDYHHYPSYLFLVLPLLLFAPRSRWVLWLFLCSVAFFLVLSSTSWIARFLLTIYPPLTLVSAYALVEFSKRFSNRRANQVCFYAVAACVFFQLYVTGLFIFQLGHLGFISGTRSRSEFLSRVFYNRPIDFINRNLPPEARVFSLGGEMCYHMKRPYISDGSWDGTEWRRLLLRNATLDDVHRDLKSQGVSHLLFAKFYFELITKTGWPKPGGSRFLGNEKYIDSARILEFGPDYASFRNWVTFDQYRRNYLELMYADVNGYEVYRLK
ncbi:MAG TPA: glycosyltransferase family 39 protein [Pyrinomonadaceae bacterium]|nr:glycosyltransferase family 39 protein [Pyrinomonadaceae bacterium]